MTTAVEVITSVQRRRRWTAAEKEQLVAASLEPGAVAPVVAREAGIHVSQLFGLAAPAVRAAARDVCGGPCGVAAGCTWRDRDRVRKWGADADQRSR